MNIGLYYTVYVIHSDIQYSLGQRLHTFTSVLSSTERCKCQQLTGRLTVQV